MPNQVVGQVFPCNAGSLPLKDFKAFPLDTSINPVPAYTRRDFYKVSLLSGHFVIQYADRSLELNGTYLFFANPGRPYATAVLSVGFTGYVCLFTDAFIDGNGYAGQLQQFSLAKAGGALLRIENKEQAAYITSIFHNILVEQSTDYVFKSELLGTYVRLLLHEALRRQPPETQLQPTNGPVH